MIRGLVFDKDGTLFDFKTTWNAWSAGLIRRFSCTNQKLKTLTEMQGTTQIQDQVLMYASLFTYSPMQIREMARY